MRLALSVVLIVLVLPAAARGADRLPDLRMKRPTDVAVDTTTVPGHRLLRYTAGLANMGVGAFELRGNRPDTLSRMTVTQRIYNDVGGYRDVVLPLASMEYETTDGHNHWHVHDLELGELLDASGRTAAVLTKRGFCFNDTERVRGNTSRVYELSGCQGFDPDALSVVMGLSVNWMDVYPAGLALQYIDVTGIPAGTYKLRVTANTAFGFAEQSTTNNASSVNVQL